MASVLELDFPKIQDGVTPYTATVEVTAQKARAVQHVQLTLTNFLVTLVDASGEYGGSIVCYLPDKNVLLVNAEVNLSVVKGGASLATTDDIDMGVGTAVASNNTLSTTMQNIIPKTTIGTDSLTVSFQASSYSAVAASFALDIPDGPTTAIYLNGTTTGGGLITADCTLTCTGTLDLWYIPLGNITS